MPPPQSTLIPIRPDRPRAADAFCTAYTDFLAERPGYRATSALDPLRARDYSRLDRRGEVYLDFTGTGLYAESQLARHHEALGSIVLGNPHSGNPASQRSNGMLEEAREAVLDYFHAPPGEYGVVFTYNATAALKLVGESFPFGRGSRFLLTSDNHNSVNGIRHFASRRHARVSYLRPRGEDLRLDLGEVRRELRRPGREASLFAFPAQSNYSGVRHPLELVAEARERGWRVLLDAAAFVPTGRLDLAAAPADFVPVSFYKMFGYPTGLGCLIARNEALARLDRPWFSGGTITIVSTLDPRFHWFAPGGQAFEDGTPDFLDLPAVGIGLEHLRAAGPERIERRTLDLTAWLLRRLRTLRHSNGTPVVRVLGPKDTDGRGPIVAFRVIDPEGRSHSLWTIERDACARSISLRVGCFCNPGANEAAFALCRGDVAEYFVRPSLPVPLDVYYDSIERSTGTAAGAVRASLGVTSNFADVYRLVAFVDGYRDRAVGTIREG